MTPAMELGLKNVIVGPLFPKVAAGGDALPSAVGKDVGILAGSTGIPTPGIMIAGDGVSTGGAPCEGLSNMVGGAAAGVVAPALANTSTYPLPFLFPGAPDMLYPPGPALGPGRLLPPAKAESIGGGAAGARSSSSPSVLTHLPSFSSNSIVLSVSSGR